MNPGPGSRERMLEAAILLMRATGLSGAGINEIVRASGAPKGSVYHFFPGGKQQLVSEALTIYRARVRGFIDQALASAGTPGDKVRALCEAFARRVEDGGFQASCAVGAVSLDLQPGAEPLQDVLDAALADWSGTIAAHFDLGDPAATTSFAGLLLTVIEGAYVRSRAERTSRPFHEAAGWLAKLVENAG